MPHCCRISIRRCERESCRAAFEPHFAFRRGTRKRSRGRSAASASSPAECKLHGMRRALLLFLLATPMLARVDRVDIATRSDLGPHFEKIAGTIHFAVDPKNPHNAVIVDLDKAPRNAAGEVEFSADFYVIRPKANGNGTLFVEISNRGGKAFLAKADPATEADIRDRFLFDRGYTVAWIGWQFDVRPEPGRVRLNAPVAPGITGRVRSDFVVDKKVETYT